MRSRTFTIVFAAIFLTAVAAGSIGTILYGYSTYTHYVDPYSYVPVGSVSSISGMGMTPVARYAVIFVLDGVRADIFYNTDKPYIDSLTWANYTNVQCSTLTSVSKVGYSVITSGVNSSESQVIGNDYEGIFKGDSLWADCIRHSNTTAVVGSSWWYDMFNPWLNYSVTYTSSTPWEPTTIVNTTNGVTHTYSPPGYYSDSLVAINASHIVTTYTPKFMVVHFSDTDEYAHKYGSVSTQYANAIVSEDTYIKWILGNYSTAGILAQTLVVVVADHGHVGIGGHGGTEPEVLHVPLLIRGPGVNPAVYAEPKHQNSIAPTVAALLGWEVPSDASGTVLFDSLSFSVQQVAIYRINLAAIRLAQATTQVNKMGYLADYKDQLDQAKLDLQNANISYLGTSYATARDTAFISEDISRSVLSSSWNVKVSDEVTWNAILATTVVGAIAILVALLFYKWRDKVKGTVSDEGQFLGITVLSISIYFVFLMAATWFTGWKFSASYFPESATDFIIRAFVPVLIAFIPSALVFILLVRYLNEKTKKSSGFRTITWAVVFFVIVSLVYESVFAFFITINGPGLPWFALSVSQALQYFYVGVSCMAFAVIALITFLGGLAIGKFFGKR
ncbi:MAG: alkaline phosphatase family protein [Candidatus Atabeyarchaeum deiterrae]